jgi:group I intron endonuclease
MKTHLNFLELPDVCGIYQISDSKSNKFYIGSAISIKKRIANHIYCLKRNIHHNPRLQALWNKDNNRLQFSVLEVIDSIEKNVILKIEQDWLNVSEVGKNPNCMNFLIIANSHQGVKRSPESIEKLRKANIGKKFSEQSKQKMRLAKLGKKLTEEHKKKIGRTGEKNSSSKLTKEQAYEVKYSKIPLKQLADKYKMSVSGLEKIRYGKSWKNL